MEFKIFDKKVGYNMDELEKDIKRIKSILLELRIVGKELAQKYRIEKPKKPFDLKIELEDDIGKLLYKLEEMEYDLRRPK